MHGCIVVGTDGSETATRALDAAVELARTFSQPLHIVSAFRPVYVDVSSVPAEYVDMIQPGFRAEAVLAEAASRCRRADVKIGLHACTGDPAHAILDVATAEHADLIVIGNRGIGSKTRFLLGNVPSRVVHHAPCSTHVVHTS